MRKILIFIGLLHLSLTANAEAMRIEAINPDPSASVIIQENLDFSPEAGTPEKITLLPAFPNSFNSSTRINYSLTERSIVNIHIYNSKGQLVKVLVNGVMPAGQHHAVWQAGGHSDGLYFVRLSNSGKMKTEKVLLIR